MHPSLLQNISQPRDLKRLSSAQIQQLCGEIRQFCWTAYPKQAVILLPISVRSS